MKRADSSGKVGIADHTLDLADGDVEGGDEHPSAVTTAFELVPFDLAGHDGQVRRNALLGLDARLLAYGDRTMGLLGPAAH